MIHPVRLTLKRGMKECRTEADNHIPGEGDDEYKRVRIFDAIPDAPIA